MLIKTATYQTSSPGIKECPKTGLPEFAFIGRSNVGKSTLINMLTNRTKLAKTSSTPGKTRLINHFLINDSWYLVDLPGYGYAKVSKQQRKKFGGLIEDYILKRENLVNLFLLTDGNIPPQTTDIEFINWLGIKQIPFSIVITKTDKPNKKTLNKNMKELQLRLKETWEEIPPVFISSSEKKTGRDEILGYIEDLLGSVHL